MTYETGPQYFRASHLHNSEKITCVDATPQTIYEPNLSAKTHFFDGIFKNIPAPSKLQKIFIFLTIILINTYLLRIFVSDTSAIPCSIAVKAPDGLYVGSFTDERSDLAIQLNLFPTREIIGKNKSL